MRKAKIIQQQRKLATKKMLMARKAAKKALREARRELNR